MVVLAIGKVVQLPARLAQVRGKVAHGTEDKGNLLLVVTHVGGLGGHLRHHQPVAGFVQRLQRGQGQAELVTQNDSDFHVLSRNI